MGNCLGKSEKLTAEIVPRDGAKVYPTVRLHGSPKSILAAYIRFALLHKSVSLDFVETETVRVGGSAPGGVGGCFGLTRDAAAVHRRALPWALAWEREGR